MNKVLAATLAAVVASLTALSAIYGMNVPVLWAVLIGLPPGVLTFVASVLSGTFDADWTAEPDPPSAGVTLHASFLTERLERSAIDQFRFTSRVQSRLRRIAESALGQDLDSAEARERLGADLHRLLTARDAQLPPPTTFAALMRRLEELC